MPEDGSSLTALPAANSECWPLTMLRDDCVGLAGGMLAAKSDCCPMAWAAKMTSNMETFFIEKTGRRAMTV